MKLLSLVLITALVTCVPGGGDHATTKKVEWKLEGEAEFINEAVPDASGDAFGPFTVGAEAIIITEVTNSSGTRTIAPRTITTEEPI